MATIHAHPSPASLSVMQSGRRVPLTSKPNAANSPFRSLITGKRLRQATHADTADPADDAQQPPLKKQAYEPSNSENHPPRTLTRQSAHDDPEATLFFSKKPSNAPVTNLGRKLHAVASSTNNSAANSRRQSPTAQRTTQPHPQTPRNAASAKTSSLDNIRQWQEHYRRAFPTFVFFFDSVTEDVHNKLSRCIQHLGAEELRFFSDQVTHVVTTRPVPPDTITGAEEGNKRSDRYGQNGQTIDPSLLGTRQKTAPVSQPSRAVQLLQSTLRIRGTQHSNTRVDPKKPPTANAPMDILVKAREWKQKVWTVEKLQRILETMARVDTAIHVLHDDHNQSQSHRQSENRARNEANLQRLVRNEKIIGPADRDFGAVGQDMVQLRGVYLYIHDIDEKTKPVMVREYNRPEEKENGKWPQFRASVAGRCPFIESHAPYPRGAKTDNRVQAAGGRQPVLHQGVPRTRSRIAEICKPEDDETAPKPSVLGETSANPRRSPRKQDQKPLDPPPIPTKTGNTNEAMPALFDSAQVNKRGLPRMIAGEPVASGLQPSNVTSAIRSQAISSTAMSSAVTGMRAGTSKEIHALQRKVLERGGATSANHSMASSYINDVRAALNGDAAAATLAPAQRAAKRKAQESLAQDSCRPTKVRHTKSGQSLAQKEPKPGYCENCNEKFDDFDEHCTSKRHRKFALTNANFAELDVLLKRLQSAPPEPWTGEL